jgi:hypothetical protein
MSNQLPPNDRGIADIYIDDSIGVAPDIDSAPYRVNQAIVLAIQILARPLDPSDPIPRSHIISQKKLLAEGQLDEPKQSWVGSLTQGPSPFLCLWTNTRSGQSR